MCCLKSVCGYYVVIFTPGKCAVQIPPENQKTLQITSQNILYIELNDLRIINQNVVEIIIFCLTGCYYIYCK